MEWRFEESQNMTHDADKVSKLHFSFLDEKNKKKKKKSAALNCVWSVQISREGGRDTKLNGCLVTQMTVELSLSLSLSLSHVIELMFLLEGERE